MMVAPCRRARSIWGGSAACSLTSARALFAGNATDGVSAGTSMDLLDVGTPMMAASSRVRSMPS